MGGINIRRWLIGGLAAGAAFFFLEGLLGVLTMSKAAAALAEHGLSMEVTSRTLLGSALISFIVGLGAVFIYAAARQRFGPGARTGVIVGVVVWCVSYVVVLTGYYTLGIYPLDLLLLSSGQGLIETVIATLLGAWLYREN